MPSTYPYDDEKRRFTADVAKHTMTVAHDDGNYRHLQFRDPGTSLGWFDIITWPGTLTIRGDMGTYVFSREDDMFSWFGADRTINPDYWGEKCQAVDTTGPLKQYDADLFIQLVREHVADHIRDTELDDVRAAALTADVDEKILDEDYFADYNIRFIEDDAHRALANYRGIEGFTLSDTWEWDLKDYSYRFLWCCNAITWAIGRYREKKAGEI